MPPNVHHGMGNLNTCSLQLVGESALVRDLFRKIAFLRKGTEFRALQSILPYKQCSIEVMTQIDSVPPNIVNRERHVRCLKFSSLVLVLELRG